MASRESVFANSAFVRLWGSQALGALSQSLCAPVWPLAVLALTGSASAAGLVGAIRSLPYLLLSLPVGVLVDRYSRATLMAVSAAARMLTFVLLVALLFLQGPSLALIYLVVAIEGSLFVVFNVAEIAALPAVVRKDQLASANAHNESAGSVIHVSAPAIGTALYQAAGIAAAAIASGVCSVAAFLLVLRLRIEQAMPDKPAQHFLDDILAGFRWLRSARMVALFAAVTALLNLLMAGLGVIAVIAAKRLGASDFQVGVIFSLAGLGGAIGALLAPAIKERMRLDLAIRGVVLLIALLVPVFATASHWVAIGISYCLITLLGPIYNVFQVTYRLERIPSELQGRVNSTYRLIAFGLMPVGAALAGVLLDSPVPGLDGLVFTAVAGATALLAWFNVTPHRLAAAG